MRDRLVKLLATGFGAGLLPGAPGTAGSLVGVAYWWGLTACDNPWASGAIIAGGILGAVWCAGAAASLYGQKDPSHVVIDELAAMPVALIGVQPVWWQVGVAFGLFRLFDIWKPPPVRQSQSLPGGWGIVVDDVLAALYACAATHFVIWVVRLVAPGTA